ncbi:MAG: O-antigen ligase family protein [Aggregatilineales bacterium]
MNVVNKVARVILGFEPFILILATYFMWFPSNYPSEVLVEPVDRVEFIWLIGLLLPAYCARYVVERRIWTRTPLDLWFIAFLLLGVINIFVAPYPSRGLIMLARPAIGVALFIYVVDFTRRVRTVEPVLKTMVILGWIMAIVALTMSQWNPKSADLQFIIDSLPRVTTFVIPGGFNPNEIGGALAWITPLMGGLMFFGWSKLPGQRVSGWAVGSGVALAFLLLALILGQSRFALIGVLTALVAICVLVVPRGAPRVITLAGLTLLILFQVNMTLNIVEFNPADESQNTVGLSNRDERTVGQRFDIWKSALDMVLDYPLTGVGMNRFRYGPVRQAYPVLEFDIPADPNDLSFQRRLIPHTHNEFVQITTDLGIPGLIVYIGWTLTLLWMIWEIWRKGDENARLVIISAGAGIVAHMAYGMGDAITLWDRFAFVYWLMMGIVAAQHRFTIDQLTAR